MKIKKIILCLILMFSFSSFASVEIKTMKFENKKDSGVITVTFNGNLKGYPELNIIGKSIQVSIPNSKVKKSIERAVSFSSKLKDTQIRVYQTNKTAAKIKALFPFSMAKRKDAVSLTISDNTIKLTFPRIRVNLRKAPKFGSILTKKKNKIKRDSLNESYLNSLLKIENKKKSKVLVKKTLKKSKSKMNKNFFSNKDKVSSSQSAPVINFNSKKGSNFSLLEYGGKFVAFLGLVLLLFYGIVTLMKKGFIKKGKLGFLNNADQISVINQTYIGPKKSLMLIKAHNQVFLVSNTDSGIHPISEIRDAAGLFKDGETAISGTNFDTNLIDANTDVNNEMKVKLKEDISKSNKKSSLSSYMNVKEKVKFSDQLKKKVKNLKPLQ